MTSLRAIDHSRDVRDGAASVSLCAPLAAAPIRRFPQRAALSSVAVPHHRPHTTDDGTEQWTGPGDQIRTVA